MPFLTIYTPTYKRPKFLAINKRSVDAQTCTDYEHIIHVDGQGVGVGGMFRQMKADAEAFRGDYVYILQDDDRLCDDYVVADLQRFAQANDNPPVIICRNRKSNMMLPDRWGMRPEKAHIDLGSYVIRRDVFLQYKDNFAERYEADFFFIAAVWDAGVPFSWFDRLIAESDQFGFGRPEE